MRKCSILLSLLFLVGVTCGFTWPFATNDKCAEAKKLLPDLRAAADGQERQKVEEGIIMLCPGGAADYYIRSIRHQRKAEIDGAVLCLREAVRQDDSLAEAHGELGLLLFLKGLHDEASVELVKGLMGKADPRYHRAMAEILRVEKIYPLALFHFEEALKAYPLDVNVVTGIAESHLNLDHFTEAEQSYRKILTIDPENKTARLGLVAVFRKGTRLDDAAKELTAMISREPRNKELHRLLGEVLQEKGDREKAREEYRLAGVDVVIDPADYVRKGDEFLADKSYDKAVTAYRAALAAKPDLLEVMPRLGDAEMAAGHDDAAFEVFRKAVARNEADGELHYKLGVLYERKGMLDEAVAEHRKALEYSPGDLASRNRLADIYVARGDFLPAIVQFRELVKARSDNPMLHLKLAKAYEKTKEYKGAIAEYLSALKIDQDNLEAHRDLAALYGKRGLHEGAESQLKEILRLKKDDSEARLTLTALYVKKKRYDDLLALLKEGVELKPDDGNSHYKLGLVYEFRKDFDSAISEYKRTVELQPTHAKGLNALGRMYLKSGRTKEARELLEAAKQADPTFAEPVRLLASVREELSPGPSTKKVHKKQTKSKVRKKAKAKKAKKVKKVTKRKK